MRTIANNKKAYEPIGQSVFRLMCLSIVFALFLPGRLLWIFGINYITAEASLLEKIHPATYMIAITAIVWFFQVAGDKRRDFHFREILYVGLGLFGAFCVLIYAAVFLGGQLAPVADSLLCAPIFGIILHFMTKRQRNVVLAIVLFCVALNIILIFYEYASGSILLPPVFSDLTDLKAQRSASTSEFDGRASGLYGHPLSAGTMTLIFIVCCVETAERLKWRILTLALAAGAVATLPTFGARWASVLFALYLFFVSLRFIFNMAVTRRISQQSVMILFVIALGAVPLGFAAFELGLFDKLIERFEYDPGSAATRAAALDMLLSSSMSEIVMGDTEDTLTNKLIVSDSTYGVEVFWIGFIMRYGLICAVIYFPALFFFMHQLRIDGGRMGTMVSIAFLALISGSLSILGKTQLFSQVVIFAYAMMPTGYDTMRKVVVRGADTRREGPGPRLVPSGIRGQRWLQPDLTNSPN